MLTAIYCNSCGNPTGKRSPDGKFVLRWAVRLWGESYGVTCGECRW